MKKVIGIILSIFAFNSYACVGEAQLIAKVASVKTQEQSCKVMIKDMSFYLVSQVCPLFASEVTYEGLTFDKVDCEALEVGESISGVAVRLEDGSITLEQ